MILVFVGGCKPASKYISSLYLEEYLGFICRMNEIYWRPTIFSSMITSSYRATLLRLGHKSHDQLAFYLPHIANPLACPCIWTETYCLSTVLNNQGRIPQAYPGWGRKGRQPTLQRWDLTMSISTTTRRTVPLFKNIHPRKISRMLYQKRRLG